MLGTLTRLLVAAVALALAACEGSNPESDEALPAANLDAMLTAVTPSGLTRCETRLGETVSDVDAVTELVEDANDCGSLVVGAPGASVALRDGRTERVYPELDPECEFKAMYRGWLILVGEKCLGLGGKTYGHEPFVHAVWELFDDRKGARVFTKEPPER